MQVTIFCRSQLLVLLLAIIVLFKLFFLWNLQLMTCSVGVGEELMPQRKQLKTSSNSEVDPLSGESQAAVSTTHIRKLCRNRGLVLQEEPVAESEQSLSADEDSVQCEIIEEKIAAIQKMLEQT